MVGIDEVGCGESHSVLDDVVIEKGIYLGIEVVFDEVLHHTGFVGLYGGYGFVDAGFDNFAVFLFEECPGSFGVVLGAVLCVLGVDIVEYSDESVLDTFFEESFVGVMSLDVELLEVLGVEVDSNIGDELVLQVGGGGYDMGSYGAIGLGWVEDECAVSL